MFVRLANKYYYYYYIQQLKVLFFSGRVQVFMMKCIERENIKAVSQFANYSISEAPDQTKLNSFTLLLLDLINYISIIVYNKSQQ